MTYRREQIQKIFQSRFDLKVWTECIINFFNAKEVNRNPVSLDIDPKEGEGYELGYLNTTDEYRIGFFYLKLNRSIDRRKVGLRQLINKYIKIDSDAGIGVFDDGEHWRLSFITDLRGEKTSPKRYTFVFGDNQNQYRTAVDRFEELQRNGISFKNIKEAFSVEALTKQFYNDLFEWYLWALKDDTGVYFPNNPNTPADDRENLDTKIIRLITRLMFVWFIKQKGLVPNALFDEEEVGHWLKNFDPQSMESGNYYQAILQNLFFATLNRPIKNVTYDKQGNEVVERRCFAKLKDHADVKSKYRYEELFKISEDKILSIYEFIPFINGGLFECLDKNKTTDGTDYAYFDDGFSRNANRDKKTGRWSHRAFVPNRLFFDAEYGIISIFNRYNFTVEENTPSEQQVALDPELLGKVFENLLGVYNPETHDTARNQSGSFYTPREIVNYMVDISLQAYLGNTDEVKSIFADDFVYDEGRKAFYESVVEKLKSIKVLDPACGSGAFPMGMLNRIVDIMERLKAPGSKYEQKLQIMENCIYGGDIQTIAAQITKLRFFISLVCDCEKSDNADENYGIPNLPNLETHFVTCNSLLGLGMSKEDLEKKGQDQSLFEADVTALKEELKRVRHEHFMAKTVYQKTKLRDRDRELREELVKMLSDDNVIDASKDAEQMANWNPYDQNAQAPFFDPEWMFGIKEGFDVVIGNPPYINLRGELSRRYSPFNYKTLSNVGDIYCLFYERGISLLSKNGHLCYITSSSWMKADFGKELRSLFADTTIPQVLIDFNGVKMFESATVTTNIILLKKGISKWYDEKGNELKSHDTIKSFSEEKREMVHLSNILCSLARKKDSDLVKYHTADYILKEHVLLDMPVNGNIWVVLKNEEIDVKRKLDKVGVPLKDWDFDINIGIMTFCNPAFIISGEKRKEILSWCSTKEEYNLTNKVICPILRGRDIQRYTYQFADMWIINTHNGIQGKFDRIHINDYPALKKHLDSYYKQISNRATQGATPYNLRSCAYLEDFYKPKVIWKRIGSILRFSFDDKGSFGLDSTCFIANEDAKFLCCILNSEVGHFLLKNAPTTGTGDLIISVQAIGPVHVPTDVDRTPFNTLVDDIITNRNKYSDAEIKRKESKIDDLVYRLYNLSPQDIKIITQSNLE